MSLETDVQNLTAATTDLLAAVNVSKATLDSKVTDATAQATNSANSATASANSASASASSAASALAIYGNTAAMNTAATNASTSASNAATSATNAANSATQAAASAASASQIVLGVASGLPNVLPSLNLDFANSKTVDPRITFSRASAATYYDGKTTAKAEENLLTYSQEFDNAAWIKGNSSITANAISAPDGTTTADAVFEFADTAVHRVRQSIATPGSYNVSVYAKPNGRNFFCISVNDSDTQFAVFNIGIGAVGTVGGGATNAKIELSSNGFYRCSVTLPGLTASGPFFHIRDVDSAPAFYTGDVTKGVYLWGAQLEQRSSVTSYTPTTTQPITNYIPALQTAAAGVPRIDHDPVTGECKGLLIEEQRTNLLTYSEQFDNAIWLKANSAVTTNAVTAPDGTLTADKLIATSSTAAHFLRFDVVSASAATFSLYAKAAEETVLFIGTATDSTGCLFDLSSGTATPTIYATGAITSVGNGWYRCTVSLTTAWTNWQYISLRGNRPSYTGDGYSGIYIWGAQLEAGAFPTSYIKTEASQVTRSADAASMTGTNFSSWYRGDEGSFYAEFMGGKESNQGGYGRVIGYDVGRSFLARNNGASLSTWNNVSDLTRATTVDPAVAFVKGAMGYDSANRYLATSSGVSTATGGTGVIPSGISIGCSLNVANNNMLNGTIKKLSYYPKRLSNSELQALTA